MNNLFELINRGFKISIKPSADDDNLHCFNCKNERKLAIIDIAGDTYCPDFWLCGECFTSENITKEFEKALGEYYEANMHELYSLLTTKTKYYNITNHRPEWFPNQPCFYREECKTRPTLWIDYRLRGKLETNFLVTCDEHKAWVIYNGLNSIQLGIERIEKETSNG